MFNVRIANKQNVAGKLLHLKRFFVLHVPLYLRLLERLTDNLSDKPQQREVLSVLRDQMVSDQKR